MQIYGFLVQENYRTGGNIWKDQIFCGQLWFSSGRKPHKHLSDVKTGDYLLLIKTNRKEERENKQIGANEGNSRKNAGIYQSLCLLLVTGVPYTKQNPIPFLNNPNCEEQWDRAIPIDLVSYMSSIGNYRPYEVMTRKQIERLFNKNPILTKALDDYANRRYGQEYLYDEERNCDDITEILEHRLEFLTSIANCNTDMGRRYAKYQERFPEAFVDVKGFISEPKEGAKYED